MVYSKRRSCFCCCLPAHADTFSRCHGISNSWRSVIPWRVCRNSNKITKRNLQVIEISRFIKLIKFILLTVSEILVTCRIIGAALIMIGLYSVLWGKTEEKRVGSRDQERTLTKHLLDTENRDKDDAPASDIPWLLLLIYQDSLSPDKKKLMELDNPSPSTCKSKGSFLFSFFFS